MTVGLYNLNTKDFIELSPDFIVGSGDGCNLKVTGDASPKQAQFKISDAGHYLLNLDPKNDVLVNMKRLPERFYIPIEEDSLIVIGEDSFIFCISGAPKTFKIKEIVESYENSSPSDFDLKKLEKANSIQNEIDSLNKNVPKFLKKAEGIKASMNKILEERKALEVKIYDLNEKIKELKDSFEANKKDLAPFADDIKEKKKELSEILKDLAQEKGGSKLELDI